MTVWRSPTSEPAPFCHQKCSDKRDTTTPPSSFPLLAGPPCSDEKQGTASRLGRLSILFPDRLVAQPERVEIRASATRRRMHGIPRPIKTPASAGGRFDKCRKPSRDHPVQVLVPREMGDIQRLVFSVDGREGEDGMAMATWRHGWRLCLDSGLWNHRREAHELKVADIASPRWGFFGCAVPERNSVILQNRNLPSSVQSWETSSSSSLARSSANEKPGIITSGRSTDSSFDLGRLPGPIQFLHAPRGTAVFTVEKQDDIASDRGSAGCTYGAHLHTYCPGIAESRAPTQVPVG